MGIVFASNLTSDLGSAFESGGHILAGAPATPVDNSRGRAGCGQASVNFGADRNKRVTSSQFGDEGGAAYGRSPLRCTLPVIAAWFAQQAAAYQACRQYWEPIFFK